MPGLDFLVLAALSETAISLRSCNLNSSVLGPRALGPLFEDLIGLVESRKINANLPLNRRDVKSLARTVLQRISYVMTPPPCAQVPRAPIILPRLRGRS